MKHLMLKAIACAVFVLPASQLEAKDYGGFTPGQTFSRKVTKIISAKADLTGKTVKAPVPNSVPKLKKGQKVKFKIGKKGQLALPKKYKTVIKFEGDGGNQNAYLNKPAKNANYEGATVYKNAKSKPTVVALNFVRMTGSGLNTETRTVFYELK